MTRITMCFLVVLVPWMASPVTAQSLGEEVGHPAIDSLATPLIGDHVPGLAVLTIKNGRVVHRAAYGVSSIESGQSVTLHTPFYIASTAKMFTAAAVLSLVDEGRLRLTDPIGRFVAAAPDYARDLTVEQLLTHTSGLADHYDLGGEERTYSNDQVIELLRQVGKLQFEPGSRPGYSNSGYVLLAMLVEELSGQAFATFLEDRFFEPFGMEDAFVALDSAGRSATSAVGYRRTEGGSFAKHDYESSTTGAGGIYASLSDLERWYRALGDGRILESTTLQRASRPPNLDSGRLTPYGMGWLAEFAGRGPLQGKWYVFAFGNLRGFRSVFQWYQEDEVLLVWLANGNSDAVLDTMHSVPELLLTKLN